ncbi:2'-5' RNA ligase family protein [Microbacterium jiangjiandongii]|uniref:2'-5' RNA ligase family protein n=1 Tax=Microbacterium jiangjiandongii TaxID=3049071 RepID=UPI00214CC6FE|nr:2'-5' RNA ligase family protein [Microbacterium sp. zg.Y843]MCR2815647.1 2'-5' RNA ligase family protein [Microbacterium sp. zg.Y843]
MPTPYMTEPALLESLRGQQYLVLRPVDAVATFYDREQVNVLAQAPGSLPHPNAGHVTLRGFAEPDRVPLLRESVERWTESTPPIELLVEAVDGFPPPFQVIIARLARTPSLVGSYASLTGVLDPTDFRRIGELPLGEWVFHLSLAYAGALDELAWKAVLGNCRRDVASAPREVISSVDFVHYDEDGEHIETFRLQSS